MSVSPAPPTTSTSHEGVVVCSVCACANLNSAAFCGSCGTRLLLFCWSCGTAAHAGQRYCQHCGIELLVPEAAFQSSAVEPGSTSVLSGAVLPAPTVMPSLSLSQPAQTAMVAASSPAPATSVVSRPTPTTAGQTAPEANWGAAAEILADPTTDDDELVEERRVVTVLFADIVGFTTLSERLDPEDVRELSATVLGRLAEAITLYGGTIDK